MSLVLVSTYFTSLLLFSFVSHPLAYCLLLLLSAISVSGCCYLSLGFSWYLAIFCLVYVGGVYILFVFVSVHSPNLMPGANSGLGYLFLSFFFFFFFLKSLNFSSVVAVEASHYLCSGFEGLSYCFFCCVLMVGFVIISVVCSEKDSFFR